MSDRVEQDQVTEYIVCGYIRAIYFSVITEISTLCKSYIGYHFNPHRDKFKWTFQCSNLKISNNIDYSSDSDANSDTVFKSPEFKVFDGKFALKLFQNYSIAYIIASFEELPSEWVTFYIQLRIKCIETGFQRTELIRFDEANHITEQYRITNNVEKYKQLTFLIDIINVRSLIVDMDKMVESRAGYDSDDEFPVPFFELYKDLKFPLRYHLEWKINKSMIKLITDKSSIGVIFESKSDKYGMFILRIADDGYMDIAEICYPQNVYCWSWNVNFICKELNIDDTKNIRKGEEEISLFSVNKSLMEQCSSINMIADIIIDKMYNIDNKEIHDLKLNHSNITNKIIKYDERRNYLKHMNNVQDEERNLYLWFKDKLGYDEYFNVFVENGFENISSLKYLTMEHLKEIGIKKLGHRLKILDEIQKVIKE